MNQDFLEERHICYFVEDRSDIISLFQVVDRKYAHPDPVAFENGATVRVTEIKTVASYNKLTYDAGAAVLLEAAQKNMSVLHNEYTYPWPPWPSQLSKKVETDAPVVTKD